MFDFDGRASSVHDMTSFSPTMGLIKTTWLLQVVLIVGQPANITRGRQALREFMEELTGTRAPRDGLVFIVPPNGLNRMPMMAANFQNLSWQLLS